MSDIAVRTLDDTPMAMYMTKAAARWLHEVAGMHEVLERFGPSGRRTLDLDYAELADLASAADEVIEALDNPDAEWTGRQRSDGKRTMTRLIDACVQVAKDAQRVGCPRRLRAPVAGVSKRPEYPENVLSIERNSIGELRPDPDNPFDPLAVAVMVWTLHGEAHIGYLPARNDGVRSRLHALAETQDLYASLEVRKDPMYPKRPGVDVIFNLPADDPLTTLLADARADVQLELVG